MISPFLSGPASTLLVILAFAGLSGCGGDAPPATSPTAQAADVKAEPKNITNTHKLAFVTNTPSDFWNIANAGIEAAHKELPGYKMDFRIGDGTAGKQKEIVEDLLVQGVCGIAISPVDPANQTDMLDNAAKQALLICQDSDAPNSKRAFYLGTDNVAAGHQAGTLVKEALPNGGTIMVFVGKKDQQNAVERYKGLKDELAGSNVTIIDLRTDDGDRARAKLNAADTLVKYPDIAGMVGLWSYNVPAILGALKDADKLGKIQVVSFDEEADTLAGIKAGSVHGTVVQQPYEFGKQSMLLMAKYLEGDTSVVPANKHILVPTRIIKADTVEEFSTNLQKLLGK